MLRYRLNIREFKLIIGQVQSQPKANNTSMQKFLLKGFDCYHFRILMLNTFTSCSLSINHAVEIKVSGTNKLRQITYVVVARGELLLSSMIYGQNQKSFKFKFIPSIEMMPSAKLLIFYITSDGEIISDNVSIEFGDDLRNFVRFFYNMFKLNFCLSSCF